ncbi:MAG: ferrochelatase, partial [Polyangiaceae bacterium]|nr:ferrochelatase [Polyangiaceae bacterium]
MTCAVLLAAHGTVDALDDLPAFLTSVRRGQPPAEGLVLELRRRYEAIGGGSPLNAITAEVAAKLERRLGVRAAWGNRLWKPYARDRVADLARDGYRGVALVALAQYSAHVYAGDVRAAAAEAGVRLVHAPNWGSHAKLRDAYASRIGRALAASPDGPRTAVVFTAHSLPQAAIGAGDPYEREVRAAADGIAGALRSLGAWRAEPGLVTLAFQSQGMSARPGGQGGGWLGPDVTGALDGLAAQGIRHVVFAPIGFLADHVEVLYDLDIEARAMAAERGMTYARSASLNADDDFIDVLADVAGPVLR